MSHRRLTIMVAVLVGVAVSQSPRSVYPIIFAGADDARRSDNAAAICDEADKLLRGGKAKEARAALEAILKDQAAKQNRTPDQSLYLHGFACLLLKDYEAAGRSLSRLSPFEQLGFGLHAHYLLGRVHQFEDERAEAAAAYEAVRTAYEALRAQAVEALKQPDAFKDKPKEKVRAEALAAGPPPEFVGRAGFYLGVLYFEAGRFAEARARFSDFAAEQKQSPLRADAILFQGFSEVQMQQFAEAIETLQPLAANNSARSNLARLWLAKAQINSADPDDAEAFAEALKKGLETLAQAASKARASSKENGDHAKEAKASLGEIVLELADTQVRAGQFKEAAAGYAQILKEELVPKRMEEVSQRRISALNLAGTYQASDQECAQFQKSFPRSLLLPEVLMRHAENAYFLSVADKNEGHAEEGARAYQRVADAFPEFLNAGLARYGLALVLYRRGKFEEAKTELEKIQAQDLNGELTYAPLVLADCLIRITPTRADDALAAGRIEEQLGHAVELLTEFASRQPDDPQVPDALLRVGLCRQRLASLITQEEPRKKALEAVRATYDQILTDYPLNDVRPQAALERARCMALQRDAEEAMNRLRPFSLDPLVKHPIAPLAMLQWATLLRAQDNKAIEAAKIMAQCRKRHEKALLADPSRADWVPLLRFHHAVALQEAGQFAEARALYEGLVKQYPDRPEAAEANLFIGQCLRDEAAQKIEQANQALGAPDLKPAAADAARKSLEEGQKMSREAVRYFESKAEELAKRQPASEVRARLLYQAAWTYRALADQEVDAARNRMREELQAKLQQEAAKNTPEGQPAPMIPPPEIPHPKVELQPSEKKTRALYQTLLEAFPDLPLANQVRLELAEQHANRDEFPVAIKLLKEALDKEPPAQEAERLRMRLGVCLAKQGDTKGALTQFETIARNAESGFAPHAHYLAGESLMSRGEWAAAAKHLLVFRDEEKFQGVGGISDAALLRLGHVFSKQRNWDESRKTLGLLVERFNESPWVGEARYAIGWMFQQEKNFDEALAMYALVTSGPKTEASARAQLQTGICQLLQKHPTEALDSFRAVPADFPALHAPALLESAFVCGQLDQAGEVAKLLRQIIHDYPKSPWAAEAKKRLDAPGKAAAPQDLPDFARLLTPDVKDAWKLEPLGQMQQDSASLDDPTVEASHAATLARTPPLRDKPAAWLKLTLPEPFEFRLPIRVEDLPAEEMLANN
jgi:cellulose synthase operon protein C